MNPNNCPESQECINTIGSYFCLPRKQISESEMTEILEEAKEMMTTREMTTAPITTTTKRPTITTQPPPNLCQNQNSSIEKPEPWCYENCLTSQCSFLYHCYFSYGTTNETGRLFQNILNPNNNFCPFQCLSLTENYIKGVCDQFSDNKNDFTGFVYGEFENGERCLFDGVDQRFLEGRNGRNCEWVAEKNDARYILLP